MPGANARQMVTGYAAAVLARSELPVSLEEMFPPRRGPNGFKPLGGRVRQFLVASMLREMLIVERRVDGVMMYEGVQPKILQFALVRDEMSEAAAFFGWSLEEMKTKWYSAKAEEMNAKLTLATVAMQKLHEHPGPHKRQALFVPQRGRKFEEKAAWSPPWQEEFLQALIKVGAIRQVDGIPPLYEAVDRALVERIGTGKETGELCPVTLLWPQTPCLKDGFSASGKRCPMQHGKNSESAPDDELDLPGPLPTAEPLSVPAPETRPALDLPPDSCEVPSPGSEDTALLSEILKNMELQTETGGKILEAFRILTAEQISTRAQLKALTDQIESVGAKLGGVRKDVDKLQESASSMSGQFGSFKKRVSDLDKSVADAIAEVKKIGHPASSRKAGVVGILKKLDNAMEDLGAVRDMALESIPGKKAS